jgi:dimethylamine monooxygenase subunit A
MVEGKTVDLGNFEYIPSDLRSGKYEIKFGKQIGDKPLFCFDEGYSAYRKTKIESRREEIGKYVNRDRFSLTDEIEFLEFMLNELSGNVNFGVSKSEGSSKLDSKLTGDLIVFEKGEINHRKSIFNVNPTYSSMFDAVSSQLPCDVAVFKYDQDDPQKNYLSALHLCMPGGWRAKDKIGKDFAGVHEKIPGMEIMSENQGMIIGRLSKAGIERYVWGLTKDRELNRHPDNDVLPLEICEEDKEFYVRIERQTLVPLGIDKIVFCFQPFLIDGKDVLDTSNLRKNLTLAIETMSEATLKYKGIKDSKKNLIGLLRAKD